MLGQHRKWRFLDYIEHIRLEKRSLRRPFTGFACIGLLYGIGAVAPASAQSVGPSFPCLPTPRDGLAHLACSDPALARADIRMVQTYYALRSQVGPAGQNPLRSEFLSFIINTRQACGLPRVEPNHDQSAIALAPYAASCVAGAYDKQRVVWAGRLTGAAAEEAARMPEQNVALQGELKALGFLPQDAVIDGVFGTGTRTALEAWQQKTGRPGTGFFGDADASALMGGNAGTPPDPMAAMRSKPIGLAEYHGPPITIVNKGLKVAMETETSHDSALCQAPNGGFLGFGNPDSKATSCRAVILRVSVDGNDVVTKAAYVLEAQTDIDTLDIKLSVRRLDPATPQPQVVISSYSGGAHCCTRTTVFTASADQAWQLIDLGQIDGDQGFDFVDPTHDGYGLIVDIGEDFLYRFASYAGSFAPTRIRTLSDMQVQDVTRDPRYHNFLLAQLRTMEQIEAKNPTWEPNGYLAGWDAQKSIVGQLDDAWRVMLRRYDRARNSERTICAVDKRVWRKDSYGYSACPSGQELPVPFPEDLALFLVKGGYVTPGQSLALGYDTTKILNDRKTVRGAATAAYEQRMLQTWFVLTRAGDCAPAQRPSSPAEAISADRASGLEDVVKVLQSDDAGKPTAVRVATPQAGDLVSTLTFYRGAAACETARQLRQNELENLK